MCLILVPSVGEIAEEELTYLKFLRVDMLARGVKVLLLRRGTFNRQGDGWKRIEVRIGQLQKDL